MEVDLADVEEEIEGWNSAAIGATEATWKVDPDAEYGMGVAYSNLNPTLSIDINIHPKYIGTAVAAMFHTQPDVQVVAFEQLTSFTQVHELFHVGQLKKIVAATKALPKPYEWWDLEVQAHNQSTNLWQAMYGENVEPPSKLYLGSLTNSFRKLAYDLDTAKYKELEEELAKPETTEARKKKIKSDMEKLEGKLKSPYSLPEANANRDWNPNAIDLDCE